MNKLIANAVVDVFEKVKLKSQWTFIVNSYKPCFAVLKIVLVS